jgi:uncharacterized protein (TIGR02118 family)
LTRLDRSDRKQAHAMVRFSVFYPSAEGSMFDHDYYRSSHVPLCRDTWHPARVEIDRGIDGPNVGAVHFFFDTAEDFQAALASEGTAAIMADVANYTTIVPVTQLSETF